MVTSDHSPCRYKNVIYYLSRTYTYNGLHERVEDGAPCCIIDKPNNYFWYHGGYPITNKQKGQQHTRTANPQHIVLGGHAHPTRTWSRIYASIGNTVREPAGIGWRWQTSSSLHNRTAAASNALIEVWDRIRLPGCGCWVIGSRLNVIVVICFEFFWCEIRVTD